MTAAESEHGMSHVLLTRVADIAILSLNDPKRRNALSADMIAAFDSALCKVAHPEAGFRCMLMTGNGPAFCAGGDLTMDPNCPVSLETHHHPLIAKFRDFPIPIVSAVNGPAVGLGMAYALLADLVVAARSARFAAGFTDIGLSPDGGSSWMLPRLIGWARAKEMLLLGVPLDANTAMQWGLVNRVVDDARLMEEALGLADALARRPTLALVATRRLMWEGWGSPHDPFLVEEARVQASLDSSEDFKEARAAFTERREPVFRGK